MLLVSLLPQRYTDKRMQFKFSKTLLLVFALVIASLVSTAVWRMQNSSKPITSNLVPTPPSTQIPSSSPTSIQYTFPIKNTVTQEQRKQFKGGRVIQTLNNHEGTLAVADYSKYPFTEFTDGEVSYLQTVDDKIVTNIKDEMISDPTEREHTIRAYAVSDYSSPLLRISTSSFEDVVNYEKKQFFDGWYNQNDNKVTEVVAFGHKGIELERYGSVKMNWDNVLIVPLNGYVYVFYVFNSTSAHVINVIASSLQFVNYPN